MGVVDCLGVRRPHAQGPIFPRERRAAEGRSMDSHA